MLRVDYSPQALEDLKLLREYIDANWGENFAKKILTKITAESSINEQNNHRKPRHRADKEENKKYTSDGLSSGWKGKTFGAGSYE